MRAVVTRVDSASVAIGGKVKSSIGKGFLILLGVHEDDEEKEALKIADKICGLRIFEDEAGKMNVNPADAGRSAAYNQSVHAFCRLQIAPPRLFQGSAPRKSHTAVRKGHRRMPQPRLRGRNRRVRRGNEVESINDGPVTIILDTREL